MRKITHVDVYPTAVGMKDVFNIGTGFVGDTGSAGDHVFVKITTDDGYTGWGEQRALPSWSYETTEIYHNDDSTSHCPLIARTRSAESQRHSPCYL